MCRYFLTLQRKRKSIKPALMYSWDSDERDWMYFTVDVGGGDVTQAETKRSICHVLWAFDSLLPTPDAGNQRETDFRAFFSVKRFQSSCCAAAHWTLIFKAELIFQVWRTVVQYLKYFLCTLLCSFLIAHSFGRRMLYPGSVGLLQKAMRPMLQQGQARLIEEVTWAPPTSLNHLLCF